MLVREHLLSELKEIKDNRNFDANPPENVSGYIHFLSIHDRLDVVGLELKDFDNAIDLVNRFLDGERKLALVKKYKLQRNQFLNGEFKESFDQFLSTLKSRLEYCKHRKTKDSICKEIDHLYPPSRLSTFHEINDLAKPLIFVARAKQIFEQSVENFDQVDLKKIENLIAQTTE